MAIKTDMLRYFVEVARSGSLAVAAKNLGRSPAAVSMMLKQLEENLGAPLFLTDRKTHLTPLGEFTLEQAHKELVHFDHTVSALLHFADSGEGRIRIAAMPAAAANLMPQVIEKLHKDIPGLLVDVEDMTNDMILSKVISETVELGIVNNFVISGHHNIKAKVILSDRMGVLHSRDCSLAKKKQIYWSDIANIPIVSHDLCKLIDEPSIRQAVSKSKTRVASALSIQSFVRTGKYVSPMPELGGLDLDSRLIFRVPEGNVYRRNIFMVWNENLTTNTAIQRCRELIAEEINNLGMTPKSDLG